MYHHTEPSPAHELSVGFTPTLIGKQITERFSSFVHACNGAAILKLAL
jgi:hypothetical protein